MLLTIISLSLCSFHLFSQSITSNWILQSDFTNDDFVYSVAVDTTNQFIYSAGMVDDLSDLEVPDFGNITGSTQTNVTSEGNDDGFLCKMDMSGNILWLITVGGNQDDEVLDICLDPSGNIYFVGYYYGSFKAESLDGSNQTSLSELGGVGEATCFIGSYSPAGDLR
ncbi:MAG: hypothetical protein ACKVOK_04875, partial [Flavobacteriales bacterium]